MFWPTVTILGTLMVVNVFAEGENKETVKRESKVYTHKRELVLVEGGKRIGTGKQKM